MSDDVLYMRDQCGLGCCCCASEAAVDISGLRLVQEALAVQIRYSRNAMHWFSYAIMSRQQEEASA